MFRTGVATPKKRRGEKAKSVLELRAKVVRCLEGGLEWRQGRKMRQGVFMKAVALAGESLRKYEVFSVSLVEFLYFFELRNENRVHSLVT